jgi:hypothetical protein
MTHSADTNPQSADGPVVSLQMSIAFAASMGSSESIANPESQVLVLTATFRPVNPWFIWPNASSKVAWEDCD